MYTNRMKNFKLPKMFQLRKKKVENKIIRRKRKGIGEKK